MYFLLFEKYIHSTYEFVNVTILQNIKVGFNENIET